MRTRPTILLMATMLGLLLPLAGTAAAQTFGSAPISGEIGDPDVDPGAQVEPGAWLRYVGDPAPAGTSHLYQWGTPRIVTPSAEDEPLTIAGSLDVSQGVVGATAMLGFYDQTALDAGDDGYQTGAFVYVSIRDDGIVVLGPSDGNVGGG